MHKILIFCAQKKFEAKEFLLEFLKEALNDCVFTQKPWNSPTKNVYLIFKLHV